MEPTSASVELIAHLLGGLYYGAHLSLSVALAVLLGAAVLTVHLAVRRAE